MPGVNHGALASAGVIAVSVAVAAAIAIYESPEIRRYADELRRRIAVALHSLGENIDPEDRPPMFNRPEDAAGFMQSRGGPEAGVDADDETRRRQREELLYWNALKVAKQEKEKMEAELADSKELPPAPSRGRSFDDFMRQDESSDKGTFVFNTGANVRGDEEGLIRRRPEGVRGLNASLYANPFADEHQIDQDELPTTEEPNQLSPGHDEALSDIYSATTRDADERPRYTAAAIATMPALVDVAENSSETERSATLDRELGSEEYMTAGQDDRDDAYASIQAWAQGSSPSNFYSPLPMSPPVPMSEPELVSDGELTPTDSASLVGSGEDVANDAASSRAGDTGRYYDVLSESEGMMTPASWSEVGSVVSESEAQAPVRA
ncbi:hypothetical protein COL154_012204 [Colletotrichum chrysophilum]|uniref:Uncharacterized protein n=1 Tax=Colletotrichum chrysophilum TaxID=1836956 RepID=A0AAD9AG89_9PEZI|nr:uncharacterized protein COL26b_010857 [Colletotrichum chrysophilum]KAJ0353219.1 hypothetical protein COL154_012204 [Colletotrichum chrysophilum]KAJ0353348.1 hypothetical protein KNSL1_002173 [Colletotrichum chrysophilum]KAJ0368498.1 hypothetical protein COL26b_010857 [Colletotrichum chrysophilum]KAK1846142.1 hypothetical protein CCHR01_11242 [Colletotrichum chrysophilum]